MSISLSLPPARESLGSPDVSATPGDPPPLLLGAGIKAPPLLAWLTLLLTVFICFRCKLLEFYVCIWVIISCSVCVLML